MNSNEYQSQSILAQARDMIAGHSTRPEWTRFKIVLLLLHIAALGYTGTHGIMASIGYAGNSNWAVFGQIFGILLTEATILYIYVQWARGRITDTAEGIIALVVYLGCLALAALNSVVDSRVNAGGELTGLLLWHLRYGLPLSPVFVLIGISAMEAADPDVLARREMKAEHRKADMDNFKADMANQAAEREINQEIRAIELATKRSKAIFQAQMWQERMAQGAIEAQARRDMPELLHRAGIDIDGDGIPDIFFVSNDNAVRQTMAASQPLHIHGDPRPGDGAELPVNVDPGEDLDPSRNGRPGGGGEARPNS